MINRKAYIKKVFILNVLYFKKNKKLNQICVHPCSIYNEDIF